MSVVASAIAGVVLAAGFTLYPGSKTPDARIEAITDRGPIKELIVRCPVGTAATMDARGSRLRLP